MSGKIYHATSRKFSATGTETLGMVAVPEGKVAEAQELVKALIREEADDPELFLDMEILLGQGVFVAEGRGTMCYQVSIHKVLIP